MKNKAKILSVRLEHVTDESPDVSHLGEYKNEPIAGSYYVDRETGEMKCGGGVVAEVWTNYERHEYKYITGFQHNSTEAWAHVSDKEVNQAYLRCRYKLNTEDKKGNLFEKYKVRGWETAQTRREKIICLNIVYCCEDAYRLETLQRGDWYYLGIIAKAEIRLSDTSPSQTIRSGGLWGIESDSEDYHKEVEQEQLDSLQDELISIGFSERAIKRALQQAEKINK